MERKEQTGHICRWMALGIMTAIVIVGCTIVIGLFEWRDRKEIECRNAELHQWRKNVHDLNLHITELSLLGGVGEVVGAPAGALIGGFFGYISGRKVSETVYDVVTQKGMPIGGR